MGLLAGSTLTDPNMVHWAVVLGGSLAAAVIDLRTRRIPNALTLPIAASGLFFGAVYGGWSGAGDSLAGFFALLLPYFIVFALKGGGAGDAKMMGAIGAWLGLRAGVVVLLAVAITGGVLSLLRVLIDRQRGRWLGEMLTGAYVFVVSLCMGGKGLALLKNDGESVETTETQGLKVAYGPAIFIGTCIGACVVKGWMP